MEKLSRILFYDTEFVGIERNFIGLKEVQRQACLYQWRKDKEFVEEEIRDCRKNDTSDSFYEKWWNKKAGLTNFTRIICFSFGWVEDGKLKISSYSTLNCNNMDEIPKKIKAVLFRNDKFNALCAHSLDADLRSITRDFIHDKLELPYLVKECMNATPWQYNSFKGKAYCTNKLSYKLYGKHLRLSDLCAILNVESPKDELDGSMIHDKFWNGNDKDREAITKYCEKDVRAMFNCFKKLVKYI